MPRLLTKQIETIDFQDVQDFCVLQLRENLRLEYKREFSSEDRGKQVAKEVAAFANAQGGVILWGVGEQGDRIPEASPEGTNLGHNPRRTVLDACADNLFPPVVPEVSEFIENPTDSSRGFLVVRVAASDEIHTTPDRTGIYVRMADRSKPMRATLETIDHLLSRRRRLVDLQEERRTNTMKQLAKALFARKHKTADYWITLGPHIEIEPLFNLRELRHLGPEMSIESVASGSRRCIPIASITDAHGIADGVYDFDSWMGKYAGCIDVFGNVTVFLHAERAFRDLNIGYLDTHGPLGYSKGHPREDGSTAAVEASSLVELLIGVLHCAKCVYSKCGFNGLLSGTLMMERIRHMLLIVDSTLNKNVIATSPIDDTISVPLRLATADLFDNDTILETVAPVVHQLLWAWGCTEDDARPAVIDRAEMARFGFEKCPRCNHMRPKNRPVCLKCRAESTGCP
ncbi:MAG: ATP-binding protein [Phycisphaerales bacterium]|nr:MAG: ATP-binding protein [Phycisphaerales bacterium]